MSAGANGSRKRPLEDETATSTAASVGGGKRVKTSQDALPQDASPTHNNKPNDHHPASNAVSADSDVKMSDATAQPKPTPASAAPSSTTSSSSSSSSSSAAPGGKQKKPCAYVWLVMKGDRYIPGAVVSAYSVFKTGTKHKLVCMVSSDVSPQGRKRLGLVMDEVVELPVVSAVCKPLRTAKQRKTYKNWVTEAFTKWNTLRLTNYSKALFVDADVVVLSNMDHLFKLPCPAGSFTSPWADGNTKRRKKGMTNPYKGVAHGQTVDGRLVKQGFKDGSFVCIGNVVLLEPSEKDFKGFKAMLKGREPFGFPGCNSMMDEQSIVRYYFEKRKLWTMIDQRYQFIPWHQQWLRKGQVPFIFHYFGNKPWELPRDEWSDLEAFWELATCMVVDPRFSEDEQKELVALFDPKQLNAPKEQTCVYCKEEKLSKDVYSTHNVFDSNGVLSCPRLKQPSSQGSV